LRTRGVNEEESLRISNLKMDLERSDANWRATEASLRQRLKKPGAESLSLCALFADASDSKWFWVLTQGRRVPVRPMRPPPPNLHSADMFSNARMRRRLPTILAALSAPS